MDEPELVPSRSRVDSFVTALARRVAATAPMSSEAAINAALQMLADRLHRDIGPADIATLVDQMRQEAESELDAVLMRARVALPRDRRKS